MCSRSPRVLYNPTGLLGFATRAVEASEARGREGPRRIEFRHPPDGDGG
jgi:hypothetical protein